MKRRYFFILFSDFRNMYIFDFVSSSCWVYHEKELSRFRKSQNPLLQLQKVGQVTNKLAFLKTIFKNSISFGSTECLRAVELMEVILYFHVAFFIEKAVNFIINFLGFLRCLIYFSTLHCYFEIMLATKNNFSESLIDSKIIWR